jgi:hypothetical protein
MKDKKNSSQTGARKKTSADKKGKSALVAASVARSATAQFQKINDHSLESDGTTVSYDDL